MTILPENTAEPDDTSSWWARRAHWTYAAVLSGTLDDWDGPTQRASHRLTVTTLGTMSFPDGALVLGDPYLLDEVPTAITQRLTADPHDVVVATATVGTDHRRVAAALLVGPAAPVARWTMAHLPAQEPRALTEHEFFGYPVDAGAGCFADLATATTTAAVMHEDAGMLEDPISTALFAGDPASGTAFVSPVPGSSPVAAFSSGWGDGYYPTWIGLDAADEVAVVVTDFLLTNEPFAPPPPDAPEAVPPTPVWRRLFTRGR